jgi:hypothetical protein
MGRIGRENNPTDTHGHKIGDFDGIKSVFCLDYEGRVSYNGAIQQGDGEIQKLKPKRQNQN